MPHHPLFLTNNPNLGSTSRILQSWLQLGRNNGLQGTVIGQREGAFISWLQQHDFQCQTNPMPWPDKRQPWKAPWHAVRAARWSRKLGIDIIHCNEHDIYPFIPTLKRFLNRPTVCHVRFKLDRCFAEWAFGGKRAPDALLWTSHQQQADSAAAVEGLIPQNRQHVVRLGLDLNNYGRRIHAGRDLRQEWTIADDEVLVGTASPLRPRKRVDEFVEVFRRLADQYPQVVGIVAGGEIPGDETYRREIEQQIADTGLGRRLRWVGNLEPVEPFHHACDISVSTSEYETFGNSVCEAMACSTPVVGYRGGSVAEVVGDTGLIVETGDLDGLTQAIERLVTDTELRANLGHKARERVATEFNPANSLKQLEGIYESLISP